MENEDPIEQLTKAMASWDSDGVRQAIEKGAPVNYREGEDSFSGKDTPLTYALRRNDCELVKFLLERGADIRIHDEYGLAQAIDCLDLVKLLVEHGLDVRHHCRRGSLDIGATPLHIASQVFPNHFDNKEEGWKERIRVMEYLIGRGAHVNDRDNEGDTPLHYAIESNYVQPVEILLDLGAAPDLGNYEGDTPLHMAVVAKDRCKEEMVQALLKRNANVNVRENSAAATPLHTAARYCVGTSIIKVLIEHGADLESRNLHNWTPLACIALWGADRYKQKYLLQSIKLLVKAGSDPRAKVGIDPCEPLVDKVLRNETGRVKKWVINYFKQYA